MSSNNNTGHNLNIHMYTLDDLLGLFDLTTRISLEDLKRAKKKVLMLHPDKSKLSSEYFLFYKKAFDVVVQFYEDQNRQNQPITEETTNYSPVNTNSWNKSTSKQINKVIGDMSKEQFQEKFNQLFEKNMQKEIKTDVNDWFSNNDPLYQIDENVGKDMGKGMSKSMDKALQQIKQQSNSLNVYRGVQTLSSASKSGNLYDDQDQDHDSYISSDPFSKLKYDDLRKVHKDQTVFAVSESDYDNMPKYGSVDQLNRARGQQILTPLEKADAQKILNDQENQYRQNIMKKEYLAKLETMKYGEKNKTVLSTFLQLTL
jgi:hypothetical protein